MSPTENKPGVQVFEMLGQEVTVDFNDRILLREILDLYDRIKNLAEPVPGEDTSIIAATRVSLDLVDEADALITKAVGEEMRLKLWVGAPIREPIVALFQLVEPAGFAYDMLLADYTTAEE